MACLLDINGVNFWYSLLALNLYLPLTRIVNIWILKIRLYKLNLIIRVDLIQPFYNHQGILFKWRYFCSELSELVLDLNEVIGEVELWNRKLEYIVLHKLHIRQISNQRRNKWNYYLYSNLKNFIFYFHQMIPSIKTELNSQSYIALRYMPSMFRICMSTTFDSWQI